MSGPVFAVILSPASFARKDSPSIVHLVGLGGNFSEVNFPGVFGGTMLTAAEVFCASGSFFNEGILCGGVSKAFPVAFAVRFFF